MDDGHGAVGHGVELVEAAGLKAAGHEQHVRAGGDAVRQAHVEAHPAPALLVPARLHLPACMPGFSGASSTSYYSMRLGAFYSAQHGCTSGDTMRRAQAFTPSWKEQCQKATAPCPYHMT